MDESKISASPEAINSIKETLRAGWAEQLDTGLIPVLCYCLNYRASDEGGRTFEWCEHPHFSIGWYPAEIAVGDALLQLEVSGAKIYAPRDTLDRLEKKQLVLRSLEVGYPTPSDMERLLLIAIPVEP